eukprot:17786-Chlamydomonas_euryale.AAC.2
MDCLESGRDGRLEAQTRPERMDAIAASPPFLWDDRVSALSFSLLDSPASIAGTAEYVGCSFRLPRVVFRTVAFPLDAIWP